MVPGKFGATLRHFVKYPVISLVNLTGLALGLAVCGLIALFLRYEWAYDRSNPRADRSYRLVTTFKYPNSPERATALSAAPMGPFLQHNNPDVEAYLRVLTWEEDFLCRSEGRSAGVEKCLAVDSSFFSFFELPLRYGEPAKVFGHSNNILISEALNRQLFDGGNSLGRTLEHRYSRQSGKDTTVFYTIAGVFERTASPSHLQCDAIIPLDERQFESMDPNARWHGVVVNTYLRLRAQAPPPAQVATTFSGLLKGEMPNSQMIALDLQAMPDIHLGSMNLEYDYNNFEKSDRKYLYVLGLIALLILLIAGINFTNLSFALANRRMKEVAVRKTIGASRFDLIRQFMGESLLLACLAGALSLLLIPLLEPVFGRLIDRAPAWRIDASYIAGLGMLVLALGIVSGIFPALRLSQFSAAKAFQRHSRSGSVRQPFVRGLVVAQFSLSVMLIAGMLICYRQLWFLRHADMGYDPSQVIQVEMGDANYFKYPALKAEISRIPGVEAVSGSSHTIDAITTVNGVMVRRPDAGKWENFPMNIIRADANLFETLDLPFLAGTPPGPEQAATGRAYVVNESFLKKVGWKGDPLALQVIRNGLPETEIGRVAGVIRDFHQNTLHRPIEPICIQISEANSVLLVRLRTAARQETLAAISDIWKQQIADRPFDYAFLDDRFAAMYAAEERLGQSLLAATLLAILIACMGLLALSSFVIQQRSKEVGVRKVLGASVSSVVMLLSREYLVLVALAVVIATPPAWYLMQQWLEDFAYRIDIQVWVFAVAGLCAAAAAFATVGTISARAALANPVQALRDE
ncbi:MAG: ABC transporter permease [Lewinellaceae bacterium]|nr:ABC transporter permease [Lewinellaceae bacterium]